MSEKGARKGSSAPKAEAPKISLSLRTLILWSAGLVVLTVAITLGSIPYLIEYFELQTQLYKPTYNTPWVKSLELEIRKQYDQQEKFPTVGELKMLWQTPLLHVNIAALVGAVDVVKFNAKLSAAVLFEYRNLLKANKGTLTKDGAEVNDANQVFFEWQAKGGWKNMRAYKEIRVLEDFIQKGVDRYLKAIGLSEDFIAKRSQKLDIWATVHEPGVSHLAHTHQNSLVSGVFYVKMPEGAGNILFDDPRGPLPPFDNKLTIKPLVGDMVIFPSWLVHQVSPTMGSEDRISIAFNIPGEWTSTVGISEWFPLE